ncbi:unnamed protein product [Clavelina lepadiformis]|uniref:Uncharacterized protein n=1 Tax=Clavelina lepadiformis TaxID=159417 RepID=A0ABP0FC32_CLALP
MEFSGFAHSRTRVVTRAECFWLAVDLDDLGLSCRQFATRLSLVTLLHVANGLYHGNAGNDVVTKNGIHVIAIPEDANPERVELKLLTWIPFELKDFNVVINTILDRAQNPRGNA